MSSKIAKELNVLVYIDDIPIYVESQTTIIQACEMVGINLPRFCYHDLLNIAGNCRICLIEIENSPKPQIACGLSVVNNIRVYTNTPLVRKARESVLEFLLLNHPLDCPICDQGGECDLQNQYLKHGSSAGRFSILKRSVEDKGFGPVVKTIITRCIHCTRCIRFAINIAGINDLGTTIRGNKIEISIYTNKTFNSEVSGNIIDLCPVGALTTKGHAFKSRPWEIKVTKSIDISDNLGSPILIESKNYKPIKVVARPCLEINEEWITDKARFSYEGFTTNRLILPYFYMDNIYNQFGFLNTGNKVAHNIIQLKNKSQYIFGKNLDFETLFNGIYFCKKIGWNYFSENLYYSYPIHASLFQSTISLSDFSKIKTCILLGINPRFESSIPNLRLNKQSKIGKLKVISLGCVNNLQYKAINLGLSIRSLLKIVSGVSNFSKYLFFQSITIYGDSLSQRLDSHSVLIFFIFSQNLKKQNAINLLRFSIGGNSIGSSFCGLYHKNCTFDKDFKQTSIYALGVQTTSLLNKINIEDTIFDNSHYTSLFVKPRVLLPIRTVYEKVGKFINFEGKLQSSIDTVARFGQEPLIFFKTLEDFYTKKIKSEIKSFCFNSQASYSMSKIGVFFVKCYLTPLKVLLIDFYRNNIVTINSLTLAKLSGILITNYWSFKDHRII